VSLQHLIAEVLGDTEGACHTTNNKSNQPLYHNIIGIYPFPTSTSSGNNIMTQK
jgi:hypothetical protein